MASKPEQLKGVINELIRRLGESSLRQERPYVIMRKGFDNDVLILGPYELFTEAAEAAGPGDTVKPLFRESDLEAQAE